MVQKTILDYYNQICAAYPDISPSDIKKICLYGWKSLLLHNKYGGDVWLHKNKFWFYCGKMTNDSLRYFKYYIMKTCLKLRVMYKRLRVKWDGYYYFAMNKREYEKFKSTLKPKGRPKKKFIFTKLRCYKLFDECNLINYNCVAIFRFKQIVDRGFKIFLHELKTQDLELVLERNPLKFNDVLSYNYNYQFLPKKLKK